MLMALRPNLFDIATSELSQDAFLCWLLTCADPAHRSSCAEVHALGQAFLRLIFSLQTDVQPLQIRSVVAERQWNKIDILCTVNKTISIAIEDKTDSVESPHQLKSYRTVVEKMLGDVPGNRTLFVYVQTGNQGDYHGVKEAGYLILERSHLIDLFGT